MVIYKYCHGQSLIITERFFLGGGGGDSNFMCIVYSGGGILRLSFPLQLFRTHRHHSCVQTS